MDYNPARHHQKIIDAAGITRSSLMTWRATRLLFGTFVEAIGHFEGESPYLYGAIGPGFEKGDQESPILPNYISSPGLLLLDEHKNELWLDGCSIGYNGEGVTATGYILLHEGFDESQINEYVPYCGRLHLVKGQAKPAVAELRRGPTANEPLRERPGRRVPPPLVDHIRDLERKGSYFRDVAIEED